MGSSLIWVKANKPIDAKTASGERVFHPGEVFQVNPIKARPLIEHNVLQEVTPSDDLMVKDFKKKNIAVRIRSEVLREDIWLVSNESFREYLKAEGLVCYLPKEILYMTNLSPKGIRALHIIKKEFGGHTKIFQ